MPAYYLDTSALVKRYATEAGTLWVTALIDSAGSHTLYTVRLTGPEMVAALRCGCVSLELGNAAMACAMV